MAARSRTPRIWRLCSTIWDIDKGTVVGASFGGQVALELALQHPERVTALVLIDSAIQGWDWSEEVERFSAAEERCTGRWARRGGG